MSPRAACRLEQIGFGEVYDYAGGKMAWVGMGLPAEGSMAESERVGSLVRHDTPTCAAPDRAGDVADRAGGGGGDVADRADGGGGGGGHGIVAVLAGDVLVGLAHLDDLRSRPDAQVADVMRPGPSTFRPSMPVREGLEYVEKHDLPRLLITRLDGTWLGVVDRAALEARARA